MANEDRLQPLRKALEQQRVYEKEHIQGDPITYHLASLYSWDPGYVLTLPEEQKMERLREIWKMFSLAGDIIKRYEDATKALLEEADLAKGVKGAREVFQGMVNWQDEKDPEYTPCRGDFRIKEQSEDVYLVWEYINDGWEFSQRINDATASEMFTHKQFLHKDEEGSYYR